MEIPSYPGLFRRSRDTSTPLLTLNSRPETEADEYWLGLVRKIRIWDQTGMWIPIGYDFLP